MKKIVMMSLVAALAACGGSSDENAADRVEDQGGPLSGTWSLTVSGGCSGSMALKTPSAGTVVGTYACGSYAGAATGTGHEDGSLLLIMSDAGGSVIEFTIRGTFTSSSISGAAYSPNVCTTQGCTPGVFQGNAVTGTKQ